MHLYEESAAKKKKKCSFCNKMHCNILEVKFNKRVNAAFVCCCHISNALAVIYEYKCSSSMRLVLFARPMLQLRLLPISPIDLVPALALFDAVLLTFIIVHSLAILRIYVSSCSAYRAFRCYQQICHSILLHSTSRCCIRVCGK